MHIHSLSPTLGSVILGLNLSQPLTEDILAELRAVWLDRQVIVLRNQSLSSDQYLAFARQLGTPDIYPFLKGLEGFPEITPILKKETETVNFGGVWHSDTTYQPRPPMATMLYALELPPIGGDTLFSNQVQAYETLSDGLKETLATLKIICRPDKITAMATRADRIAEQGRDTSKDNLVGIHPVIRTHPETERKSLYVNPAHSCHFEGWSIAESDGLLNFLYAHQIREEFQCRHVWQEGDLAIWDNRCTLHYPVNDYHGHRRLLHRITLKGDKPV
tara:strand:- start:224 stop:1048 length:825 start_codon:yes stop_codon:yes gene_type:complete